MSRSKLKAKPEEVTWKQFQNRVKDVPASEYSLKFLQSMLQAMGVSSFKYGLVADAYPHKVNAVGSLLQRLIKYVGFDLIEQEIVRLRNNLTFTQKVKDGGDGNAEWLVDVGNFAMIEFMLPRHPDAHYKPTDSDSSPGRVTELEVTSRSNENIT